MLHENLLKLLYKDDNFGRVFNFLMRVFDHKLELFCDKDHLIDIKIKINFGCFLRWLNFLEKYSIGQY